MIRVFTKVWNVLLTCLVIAAVFLAMAFGGVRFAGFVPYTVLSGSMEPELPVGSLIYVRSVNPSEVRVGDIITFKLDSGTLVTHEVYEIDEVAREFKTHGIANVDSQGNISPDAAPVPWSCLVGTVVASIPLLGYVNVLVTQPPGVFIVIAGIAAVIGVSIALELWHTRKRDKRASNTPAPKHMR